MSAHPTVRRIIGPTIKVRSGNYFDLEAPDPHTICIADISHALANLCRYVGHCHTFYSVAQHSVLVSRVVPPEHALAALLHDAAEAYIGDVSKPLKLLLPDYKVVEARVEAAIAARYRLPQPMPACVKHADLVLLRTEQRDLMDADADGWIATDGIAPMAERIFPMTPAEARRAFRDRYCEVATARARWEAQA